MTKKILVCGGRDFNYKYIIFEVLDGTARFDDFEVIIIHGNARGVDKLAGEWAELNGYKTEIYPADWERFGKRAGFIRNKQMLEEGKPDLVIAFPGGKGTKMMVNLAIEAGIRVIDFNDENN